MRIYFIFGNICRGFFSMNLVHFFIVSTSNDTIPADPHTGSGKRNDISLLDQIGTRINRLIDGSYYFFTIDSIVLWMIQRMKRSWESCWRPSPKKSEWFETDNCPQTHIWDITILCKRFLIRFFFAFLPSTTSFCPLTFLTFFGISFNTVIDRVP